MICGQNPKSTAFGTGFETRPRPWTTPVVSLWISSTNSILSKQVPSKLSGSLCNQCERLALDVRLPIVQLMVVIRLCNQCERLALDVVCLPIVQLMVVIGVQVLLPRRRASVMSSSLPEEAFPSHTGFCQTGSIQTARPI